MDPIRIGIIGGSGLYRMHGLTDTREHIVDTPFGPPSDALLLGKLDGVDVAFLARHGRDHNLIPGQIPFRANIYAMKALGVQYLLSVSVVGSLREEIAPLDMVLPDQFIDFTRKREASFFGDGAVAHVALADPVCGALRGVMAQAYADAGFADVRLHDGGTYVCIEGPAFSTWAESNWYRSLGASVIGMTNMPEARLAREAEIAYATLALAAVVSSRCKDPARLPVYEWRKQGFAQAFGCSCQCPDATANKRRPTQCRSPCHRTS